MKPRTQMYRILARCKAGKHGPTEKAKRKRENEKVAQELHDQHSRVQEMIKESWDQLGGDW